MTTLTIGFDSTLNSYGSDNANFAGVISDYGNLIKDLSLIHI